MNISVIEHFEHFFPIMKQSNVQNTSTCWISWMFSGFFWNQFGPSLTKSTDKKQRSSSTTETRRLSSG